MDWTVIVGPAAGILIVIVDRWLQQRKTAAEAGKAIAEADLVRLKRLIEESDFWERLCHDIEIEYTKLSERQEDLRRHVEALSRDLDTMKHLLAELWAGLRILLRQLRENHMIPDWEPSAEMTRELERIIRESPHA